MKVTIIRNGVLVNEGESFQADIKIEGTRIVEISRSGVSGKADEEIDAEGLWILPGFIDDQVHFREPGLTHKAEIYTEAKAAVAGGITSFMEMPNTIPNTVTHDLLEEKYDRAAKVSLANYSFYFGGTNENVEEVKKVDATNVCGVKIFMGSSTGNMLVDNQEALRAHFCYSPVLIATHCEDEATIKANLKKYTDQYGDDIPIELHPVIRSREACYKSSSLAVEIAKDCNARLHILHISTAEETSLFERGNRTEKRITAEACVHHLWFDDSQYKEKGTLIKWNPAVKSAADREAIWKAVKEGNIDVLATDHAPHTLEEKQQPYTKAPSGGPLVQHALLAILEKVKEGVITKEMAVDKMAHAVADIFQIEDRGYLREGYFADIVIVNPNKSNTVSKENILYKCGWSPFEGQQFSHTVEHTFISGHHAYNNGKFDESVQGERLTFNRG